MSGNLSIKEMERILLAEAKKINEQPETRVIYSLVSMAMFGESLRVDEFGVALDSSGVPLFGSFTWGEDGRGWFTQGGSGGGIRDNFAVEPETPVLVRRSKAR